MINSNDFIGWCLHQTKHQGRLVKTPTGNWSIFIWKVYLLFDFIGWCLHQTKHQGRLVKTPTGNWEHQGRLVKTPTGNWDILILSVGVFTKRNIKA